MRYARVLLATGLFLSWATSHVEAQSFSLDTISPSVQLGNALGDDVLALQIGAVPPVLPAPLLGYPGVGFEVDAFSFGRPANQFSTNTPAFFSVDIGISGVGGTAVAIEFNNALGSEDSSDVFFSTYNSNNSLALDGDGNGTFPNPNVPGLGVAEPASFVHVPPPILPSLVGDVDALDMRSVVMPANSPTGATYFSIDPTTAASGVYGPGISAGDVFVGLGGGGYDQATPVNLPPAAPGGVTQPYATEIALGFLAPLGNDIDALVVFDDGDNSYSPGTDVIVFSLAPGSPYIGTLDPGGSGLVITAGDILVDAMTSMALYGPGAMTPSILHTAESLGLVTIRSGAPSDGNLNALDIVPEPSTWVLLVIGAIALLLRRVSR